jgi:hypothetical protein
VEIINSMLPEIRKPSETYFVTCLMTLEFVFWMLASERSYGLVEKIT